MITVPLLSHDAAGGITDSFFEPVRRHLLVSNLNDQGVYFALAVRDDSMDRVFRPGSIIVVDALDKLLCAGQCYLFTEGKRAVYRRFEDQPARIVPASNNAVHHSRHLRRGIQVIGRVVKNIIDY